MRDSKLARTAAVMSVAVVSMCSVAVGEVTYVDSDPATGSSAAVVVPSAHLVHTSQLLPLDEQGELVGNGDAARQISQVLANLSQALKTADSDFQRLVKVNVYVRDASVTKAVQRAFAAQFSGSVKPAVSFVSTSLPHADALVAMDAVAITPKKPARQLVLPTGKSSSGARVGILPSGNRVYISGQAARGKSLAEATRLTMKGLGETLEFLKLDRSHVVQVKAFMGPMSDAETVEKEVASFFAGRPVPPLVLVEWKSSLPIEIELIAASPKKASPQNSEAVEYLTPPGVKASPVYSRIARANHSDSIYISGLYAEQAGASGETQVREIFAALSKVTAKAGGDLRHLVKATYYVSDKDSSSTLNKLRPEYYDPKRPPAASKAMVEGVGFAGKTITLDMITVPLRLRNARER